MRGADKIFKGIKELGSPKQYEFVEEIMLLMTVQ